MSFQRLHILLITLSDGQALANRITRNLHRAAGQIKRTIGSYNNSNFSNKSGGFPDQLLWADIINPSWKHYEQVDSTRFLTVSAKLRNS